MTNPSDASLDELIETITTWSCGMPVRDMERVLATGETAVPALAEALARWQEDESRDVLWLLVLLGELRASAAIEPLIRQLRRTDFEPLAQVAGEGLAKIGPAAVPALAEVIRSGELLQRLYAYASLGWIQDDRARDILVQALRRDPELREVVAMALGEQGRSEVISALYEAYQTCEPWQRIDLEQTIQELHRQERGTPLWMKDWRLRYRRIPELESFTPGWVGVSAVVHQNKELQQRRPVIPLRPLEEILKDPPEPEEPSEHCEQCGAPLEQPTGLPACPETALSVATYQLNFLSGAREDGLEDLFDLLDEIEEQERDHLDRGEPLTPAARERWQDELEELHVCRRTCEWLIEQSAEEVGPARALLLAKGAWLANRYGDPEGLFRPAGPVHRIGPKVGRNDPCPCGSGRKYKYCCLLKGE